ncbi:MAG TPA: hypothetical protein VN496_16460 [Burkholderiales bacterium]|nr:hypothetical protein [Burkholderiales bacterium]
MQEKSNGVITFSISDVLDFNRVADQKAKPAHPGRAGGTVALVGETRT